MGKFFRKRALLLLSSAIIPVWTFAAGSSENATQTCQSARSRTAHICGASDITQAVAPLLTALMAQRQSDDLRAACATAQRLQMISAAANTGLYLTCTRAASSCVTTCEANRGTASAEATANRTSNPTLATQKDAEATADGVNVTYCRGKKFEVATVAAQAVQAVSGVLAAQQCQNTVEAFPCTDPNNHNDPAQCPNEYCLADPIGRANEPACKGRFGTTADCSNPQFASTNPMCICQNDPTNAICSQPTSVTDNSQFGPKNPGGGNFGSLPGDRKPGSATGDLFGDDDSGDEFEGTGTQASKNTTTAPLGTQGGGGPSGLGGGGGGSSALGSGGAAKADPASGGGGGGTSGGSGGYAFARGAQPDEGGGGGGKFGGRGGKDEEFDWKKFLPGGEKDPNRKPAGMSAEMFDAGVTAANGMTNFQKISRKMNEKRGALLPP